MCYSQRKLSFLLFFNFIRMKKIILIAGVVIVVGVGSFFGYQVLMSNKAPATPAVVPVVAETPKAPTKEEILTTAIASFIRGEKDVDAKIVARGGWDLGQTGAGRISVSNNLQLQNASGDITAHEKFSYMIMGRTSFAGQVKNFNANVIGERTQNETLGETMSLKQFDVPDFASSFGSVFTPYVGKSEKSTEQTSLWRLISGILPKDKIAFMSDVSEATIPTQSSSATPATGGVVSTPAPQATATQQPAHAVTSTSVVSTPETATTSDTAKPTVATPPASTVTTTTETSTAVATPASAEAVAPQQVVVSETKYNLSIQQKEELAKIFETISAFSVKNISEQGDSIIYDIALNKDGVDALFSAYAQVKKIDVLDIALAKVLLEKVISDPTQQISFTVTKNADGKYDLTAVNMTLEIGRENAQTQPVSGSSTSAQSSVIAPPVGADGSTATPATSQVVANESSSPMKLTFSASITITYPNNTPQATVAPTTNTESAGSSATQATSTVGVTEPVTGAGAVTTNAVQTVQSTPISNQVTATTPAETQQAIPATTTQPVK